jgi:hypothetical protein
MEFGEVLVLSAYAPYGVKWTPELGPGIAEVKV